MTAGCLVARWWSTQRPAAGRSGWQVRTVLGLDLARNRTPRFLDRTSLRTLSLAARAEHQTHHPLHRHGSVPRTDAHTTPCGQVRSPRLW